MRDGRRLRDVSNPPENVSNRKGTILEVGRSGTSSERLCRRADENTELIRDYTVILADGFDILSGSVEVTVPWVLTRDDYSVICECPRTR